jgi:hypothetical protein
MIIGWSNIDHFKLRSDGYFNRTDVTTSLKYVKYILIDKCESCGEPFFADIRKVNKGLGCFCSLSCFNDKQKELRPDNRRWIKQEGHRYSIYQPQLEPYGVSCRCDNDDILEVRCMYCGKWFIPNGNEVRSKVWSIKTGVGECNLYCSEGCKYQCSTYRKISYPKGFRPATSREVQPQLRKLVFERDNWTCQKCHSVINLHCHHITGIELNPIESADVDNCITFCKDCHKEVHKLDGCKYGDHKKC